MMKAKAGSAACLGLILGSIGVLAAAQEAGRGKGAAVSIERIQAAHGQLRSDLVPEMLSAAKAAKIRVSADGMAVVSHKDALLSIAGVEGLGRLTSDDFARGAVVGVVHIIWPKGVTERHSKKAIPSGTYILKVLAKKGSTGGEMQLLNTDGSEFASLPATFTPIGENDAEFRAGTVSGDAFRDGTFFCLSMTVISGNIRGHAEICLNTARGAPH